MRIHFARLIRLTFPLIALALAACGGNSSPPATYTVGGTVEGLLPGNSITLSNNDKDSVTRSANGAFAFKGMLADAASYSITLTPATPIAQPCTVSNGTGSVNASNVTTLKVVCEAKEFVAGQVEITIGAIQAISAAGQSKALHQGDSINEGDTLRSGPKASARIKMGDGGLITMRPDTEFKIDSFKFNGQQDGTEQSFFSLAKGGFRSVTGLIGKLHKDKYHIKTATAVLGIRGTDHAVYVVVAGSEAARFSPVGTYDTVYSGATTLTNDKSSLVIEPKQMGYVAAPDEAPKLKPVDTRLFVPEIEPPAQKAEVKAPPPAVVPAAVTPPPVAAPAPVAVPQAVKVEYPFDGRWATKLVCEDTVDKKNESISGFTWEFETTIEHGKLIGQHGKVGKPGSGTFTGEMQDSGKVTIVAKGLTGKPENVLGKKPRGTPYAYEMQGEFSGSSGHATRTMHRPCQATFKKQ